MELVILKVFDNPIDIHILKAKLESEGITCFIFDENIVSVNPLYNITVGGIKLKVRRDEYEKAVKVLREIEQTPYTDDQDRVIACPKCGSEDVLSGQRSAKGIRGFFSMLIAFALTIFPIGLKNKWRCNVCSFEFETSRKD